MIGTVTILFKSEFVSFVFDLVAMGEVEGVSSTNTGRIEDVNVILVNGKIFA